MIKLSQIKISLNTKIDQHHLLTRYYELKTETGPKMIAILSGYTKLWNYPEPPRITQNEPELARTSQNLPEPTRTSQNQPEPARNNQNKERTLFLYWLSSFQAREETSLLN